MHVNFKYVVVSIGSIFLALGIGILIGSNMGSNEAMQKQNQAIVSDINKQVAEIKEKDGLLIKENKKIRDSIESYNKYIESHKSELTSNKLKGRIVGIISFNQKGLGKSLAKEVFDAGGSVGFNIQINNSLFSEASYEKINSALGINIKNEKEVVSLLNDSIRNSNNSGVLTKLASMGYVNIEGFNSQFDSLTSIIVANSQNANYDTKKDNPILDVVNFMKNEKQVVVVQSQSTPENKMDPFIEMKVATINNVDQTSGQISLINCLYNEKIIGNFGYYKDDNDGITTIAIAK